MSNATISVRGGRIVSVTENGPAGGMDAGGAWVTPGFVYAFSQVGIAEGNGLGDVDDRFANRSPYSAALDVRDAFNPATVSMGVLRRDGVTSMAVVPLPGRDIFAGQAAVYSTAENVADPILKPHAFQLIDLSQNGANDAGGSRTAAFARLRDPFLEARAFSRNPNGYEFGRTQDSLFTRADAEALVDVVTGKTTALIAVERASDIRRVLGLKREYPSLEMVLIGASEGWLVAPEIAAAGVAVMAVPEFNLPASFETLAATQSNIGRMVNAGVKVAAIDTLTSTLTPQLAQQAAQLVAQSRVQGATGLQHARALMTVTSMPADMIGLPDAGRIAPGARADIVVWDGDPLEATSAPTAVYIGGVQQPTESRQTKLRDRYNPTRPENGLPPAYSGTR